MGQPGAKQGDQVTGVNTHIITIPALPRLPMLAPIPHPFSGILLEDSSTNVKIQDMPAATVNSVGRNLPPHIPQGGSFQKSPLNQGKVIMGNTTGFINNKPAVRARDTVMTCNDPVDASRGKIITASTVISA